MSRLLLSLLFLLSAGCYQQDSSTVNPSGSDQHQHQSEQSYYTCSMHPKVKQDGPGKCPICHMNLTKVISTPEDEVADGKIEPSHQSTVWQCKDFPDVTSAKQDQCPIDGTMMVKVQADYKSEAAVVVGKVLLRKSQMKHFSPDFFPVTRMKMEKRVHLLGRVLQSEENISTVPSRVRGRVERVYVKSTGSLVRVGDPVVDLYAPKLISAGEEYLIAQQNYKKNNSREFRDMLKRSEERLKLWGVMSKQYQLWAASNRVPQKITIYSSTTGIVRKRNAVAGRYFKEGENFLELSDLSTVWVELDIYEQDANLIQIGQSVSLEFIALPGKIQRGEIDFINPVFDAKARTLKVRATIPNQGGELKPGMAADATLNVQLEGEPLVVPRTAVIDTGKRKVVWVKGKKDRRFIARQVETGHEMDGYIAVNRGLTEGESVVIEGNFLLDAQAQLFGGYESMGSSSKDPHAHH
jgi:RND family efflux transporter MFP subunit